jgi:hypothetical protein
LINTTVGLLHYLTNTTVGLLNYLTNTSCRLTNSLYQTIVGLPLRPCLLRGSSNFLTQTTWSAPTIRRRLHGTNQLSDPNIHGLRQLSQSIAGCSI